MSIAYSMQEAMKKREKEMPLIKRSCERYFIDQKKEKRPLNSMIESCNGFFQKKKKKK